MGNGKFLVAAAAAAGILIFIGLGVCRMNSVWKKSAPRERADLKADGPFDVGALEGTGKSRQVVIVAAQRYGLSDAFLQTWEKNGNAWRQGMAPVQAVVGMGGFAAPGEKREGDHKSPSGVFSIPMCFGNRPNPGVRFPYRQVDTDSYWVDDPESAFYNTFQTGEADGRWKSAENLGLTGAEYDYAAVIGYNTEKRVPGKGSAIFLHVWNGPGSATEGCTALSEENLLSVLKWLDPAKDPVIIEGVAGEIPKLRRGEDE
mgnify:CR=1 FL=1